VLDASRAKQRATTGENLTLENSRDRLDDKMQRLADISIPGLFPFNHVKEYVLKLSKSRAERKRRIEESRESRRANCKDSDKRAANCE